jgi:hypothetical protein
VNFIKTGGVDPQEQVNLTLSVRRRTTFFVKKKEEDRLNIMVATIFFITDRNRDFDEKNPTTSLFGYINIAFFYSGYRKLLENGKI